MELPLGLPPTSRRLLVEVPAATVFAALSARGLPWWLLSKLAAGALRGGRPVDLMALSEADLERSGIVHPRHKQQVWMGLKSLLQDFGPSTGQVQLPRPRSGRKVPSRPQQRPSTSVGARGRAATDADEGTSGQSRQPDHRFGPWLPPGPFRPPPLEEVLESRRETFCSDAPSRKVASPREAAVPRSPKSAADSSPRGTPCGSPSSWRRKQVTCKVDTGRAHEVKRKDFIPLEELAACQRAAALRKDASKETVAPADDGGLDWEQWLTYRLKPSGPLHVVEKLVEAALGTNSQLLHDAVAVVEEQGEEFKKCLESTPPPDQGMELLSDPGLRQRATSLWSWVHARSDQLDLYKAELQRQLEDVSKNIMMSQLVTLKNNRLSSHGIQQRACIARRGPSAGTISWRNSLKSELSESLPSGALGSLGVFSNFPSRECRRSVEAFEAPPLLEGQGRAATGSSSFSGIVASGPDRLRRAVRAVMLLLRCVRVFNFNRAENEQVTYERRRNLILRQQEQLAKDGAQLIAMLERGGVDDLREDVNRVLGQLKSVREELLERYALHGKKKVEQALAEAMKKGDDDCVDLDKLGNVLLEILEEPGNHVLLGEKALRQAQQAGLACRVDLVDQGPYAWEGLSVPPPWEELFLKSLEAYQMLRCRQPPKAWRRLRTLVAVGVSSQPIQQGDETV